MLCCKYSEAVFDCYVASIPGAVFIGRFLPKLWKARKEAVKKELEFLPQIRKERKEAVKKELEFLPQIREERKRQGKKS